MLTREDMLNLYEFVHQARQLGLENRILTGMDLADQAWNETVQKLDVELEKKQS